MILGGFGCIYQSFTIEVQCNLDLVTLLVSVKTVTKLHNITKSNDFMSNNKTILCGLGCRDSLRLEAGLSLYGNELSEDITPVEANLSWAISNSRMISGGFNGYKIISKQIQEGITSKRIGILSKSKSILRSKMNLLTV